MSLVAHDDGFSYLGVVMVVMVEVEGEAEFLVVGGELVCSEIWSAPLIEQRGSTTLWCRANETKVGTWILFLIPQAWSLVLSIQLPFYST